MPGGRPKKTPKVTTEQFVETLCSRHCPTEDIALELGIARATLWDKYSDAIKRGHSRGRNKLREMQWIAAESGNVTMQIWLGKQILGQTDKLADLSRLTDDELRGFIAGAAAGARRTGEAADGAPGADETGGNDPAN
jgi:hypothetical protein